MTGVIGTGQSLAVGGVSEPTLKVQIQGDAVLITLAAAPSGSGLTVQYAVTQDGSGHLGGLATGRIGLLCDSDPFVGYVTKVPQPNYAVSFSMPVN
jgi:hypothetical protein